MMMKTDVQARSTTVTPPPRPLAPTTLTEDFVKNSEAILRLAMRSLFERLNNMCEGAMAVDANARIVWISDKYVATLGLASAADAVGKEVEEVLPNSLMREVVRTGQPLLLDIMAFGEQSLVVTRMPILDEDGKVMGAIGFVLYDRVHYLKPLVAKFASLQMELADAQNKLVQNRRARFTFASFIGTSPAALEVKRQARRAAQTDTTVLLLGETGTGKELLAHAIHASSARAKPVHRGEPRRGTRDADGSRVLWPGPRGLHRRRPQAETASSSSRTAARCSSTRSAICRSTCRRSCCACCRTGNRATRLEQGAQGQCTRDRSDQP